MAGTEWMQLAVPSWDYEELRAIVTRRQLERGEPASPPAEAIVQKPSSADAVREAALADHQPWPEEALARLALGTTITTQRWTQVLDLLSAKPGKFYSTSEIAEITGMRVEEWRAACRKTSAHLRKHYPDVPVRENGNPWWPSADIAGRTVKASDEVYFGVTEEQARRWRTVR